MQVKGRRQIMERKNNTQLLKIMLKRNKNVIIKLLGDSITHGVGGTGWMQDGDVIIEGVAQSPNSFCWANLFRDYMKEQYGAIVVNKACSGTNIEFILEHFSKLVDDSDDIIICTIGTNNRHKHFWQGERPTREAHFKEFYSNIKKLYENLTEMGKPVIFMANIPASEENEQDGGDYWRILHMNDINDAYKQFAKEYNVPMISLYDLKSAYCEEKGILIDTLLCDGLHPNDEGYRLMFDFIVKALDV